MEGRQGVVEHSRIIMDEILPPRLEDAGLEDCALPVESIREAFLKAASAVGSRGGSAFTSYEEEDDEEDDGSETLEKSSDCSDDPPPATLHSDVVIDGGCAAKDGDSKGAPTRKDVDVDEQPCAVSLQKLEIR